MTGLVREFLEYFDLDFTIAVFDPETNFVSQSKCTLIPGNQQQMIFLLPTEDELPLTKFTLIFSKASLD